jgi:hypothetical protein
VTRVGLRQHEAAGPAGEAFDQVGEIGRAQVLRLIVRGVGVGDVLAQHRLTLGQPAQASRDQLEQPRLHRQHVARSS